MYKQLAMVIFAVLCSSPAQHSSAGEPVEVTYEYQGKTGVNLGRIVGGPLSVNAFTDQRNEPQTEEIQRPGKDPITLTELAPHALVQSAIVSAFEHSGASLGEPGSPLALDGKLIEMKVQDTETGLEVLIRCELTLRNQGRNAWQSVVFGRAVLDGQDVASAIALGLDKLITELFRDDYFLMELGVL
ncbi:hypothetical protein E3V39_15545 [Gammaproteobacteria bacterium LSUCC0112]|nr:hypothetical protein E3V39_15545 [Gammaproteobacteria bacterium LSUCC0112]